MGRRASVGGAQKSVAIKFMSARVAADERHRRMFLAEARLSMLMTHSNVVQVFDAGEDAGRLYLVMEWIDGLNLAQLCELQRGEGKPWAPRLSAYVIGEVLRGLAYAHHLTHEGKPLCVVHRDVSPHNVLVSTSGEVKLADFGVARLTTEETSGVHIKGKLRYMAPEHLAGRSREPTVDLYGVGAVLHEMLTGTRFRDEADEVDLYGQILGGYVPPLGVGGVPPELASLRDGLLQAEPRQRIPTAARALEYLGAWAGYRNAAVELGALCRAAMGVVAPRSGIESVPTLRSVDPEADTQSPSVATHTAHGPVPTRTSGAAPAATSGAVPVAVARPTSAPTLAATSSRPIRRRGLLVGASVLGLGFTVGGVAVAVVRMRGREGSRDDGERPATGGVAAPVAPVEPAPPGGADEGQGGSAGVAPPARPSVGEASAVEGEPDPEASTSSGEPGAGDPGPTTGVEPASVDDEPSEPVPARRKPKAPAVVELRLRGLRTAEVRIGKLEAIVQPIATLKVPAGTHAVQWRAQASAPWNKGRKVSFAAGGHVLLRVTPGGIEIE